MSYQIYLTDGTLFATVANNTLNTDSSMTLMGQDYPNYGDFLDTNLIHLLENSSNAVPPVTPLTGQLWWDTNKGVLQVWNGDFWKTMTGSNASTVPPSGSIAGDLWFNTTQNVLYAYNGSQYIQIGPQESSGTGAISTIIVDSFGVSHNVVEFLVNSQIVGIISDAESFIPANSLPGFGNIDPGFTLANTINGVDQFFSGTSTNSLSLDGYTAADFMKTSGDTGTTGNLFVGSSLTAVGNIHATYYIGNGAFLTGISGGGGNTNYSNANVAAYLASGADANNIVTTANVDGLNGNFTNQCRANLFIGDFQGNITGNIVVPGSNTQVLYNLNGNVGADIGFTYNSSTQTANIGNTVHAGNLVATGNVSGTYVLGNGAFLTGISGGGNAGVSSIAAGTGITVSQPTGAVTVTNAGVTSIIAGTNISISGATGAVTISASGGGGGSTFPTGTRLLFQQSTAPTGWTRDTTYNNYALRIVSGSVASGGTVPFTSAFGGSSVDGTAISVDQMPGHNHGINDPGHNHGFGGMSGTTDQTSVNHQHNYSGTTSGQSANHDHGYTYRDSLAGAAAGGSTYGTYNLSSGTTTGVSNDHTHDFGGVTAGMTGADPHAHTFSINGGATQAAGTGINVNGAYTNISTGGTGGGGTHSHSLSQLAVQYVDAIIGVAN